MDPYQCDIRCRLMATISIVSLGRYGEDILPKSSPIPDYFSVQTENDISHWELIPQWSKEYNFIWLIAVAIVKHFCEIFPRERIVGFVS